MVDHTNSAAARAFLVRVRDRTHGAGVPPELRRLASSEARRMRLAGGDAAADDLLGELLARLVSTDDTRAACDTLLALDDRGLVGTLRHRLRQLALEAHPRWKLIRTLRGHLRGALEMGLPAAPVDPPHELTDGTRLSRTRIALCASWLRRDARVSLSVGALASQIAARYFPEGDDEDAVELAASSPSPMDELAARRDALRLRARLPAVLGENGLAVLLRVRNGETLTSIATSERLAVSSVHARLRGAVARLRAFVVDESIESPAPLLDALDALDALRGATRTVGVAC